MRKPLSIVTALVLGFASLSLVAGPGQAADRQVRVAEDAGATRSEARRQKAEVVEVTDGDSIKVRLVRNGAPRNVRLIGIDTSESHGQIECGGPEASTSLKRILPVGTIVKLIPDPLQDNRDLFNRLLRYVVKPGGMDVARRQLRKGWAQIFVFGGETFERRAWYRKARNRARHSVRGTWGMCDKPPGHGPAS
jgi:endonuclease YncB( thermonuclease family)